MTRKRRISTSWRGKTIAHVEDRVWRLIEFSRRWKLKLSPGELPATAKRYMTASLPKGKTLQDVFADFIRYLFDSAKAFIQESEPLGDTLWESVQSNIDLVLSHPNGWEGREQEFLRKSVVEASIFTEEEALSRVSFVTEGEATFNFCVANAKSGELLEVPHFLFIGKYVLNSVLQPGHKVLVVDAGGGTIDVSSYTVKSTMPLQVEESHEPKCNGIYPNPIPFADKEIRLLSRWRGCDCSSPSSRRV